MADMENIREKKQSRGIIELLIFKIGNSVFSLEASRVREVLKYPHLTEVPRMPAFLPGVINVRGNVISVIGLARVLGMDSMDDGKTSWMVIAETGIYGETQQVGLMASAVEDVILLDSSRIEPAPEIGVQFDTEFIRGIVKQDDSLITILDIDKIMSAVDEETVRILGDTMVVGTAET